MAERPRSGRGERGAAALEFALIFPIAIVLAFGILTGGIMFNQQLALTHGAREASRLGGTLFMDHTGSGVPDEWLDEVAARALESAQRELNTGVPGRLICVAYVGDGPGSPDEVWTRSRIEDSEGVTYSEEPCFQDTRGAEPRIQVRVQREGVFDALLYRWTRDLVSQAIARYELVRR